MRCAPLAHLGGRGLQQQRQMLVGEPVGLGGGQQLVGHGREVLAGPQRAAALDQLQQLVGEPRVVAGELADPLHRPAARQRLVDELQAPVGGPHQPGLELGVVEVERRARTEADAAVLEAAQRLVQRLLEGAAHGHHLAHRLHAGGERVVGAAELLEGEPRDLGDHVVDGGLEGGLGLAGDVVGDLVQRVADGELRGDLGDREAGGLGGQRGRAAHPRVHLDHQLPARLGVDGELHVGAAGLHPDAAQHREGRVAHLLVLAVGERHRRRDRDRVAGVHPHRVEVLDRADDHAVVVLVPHDLELVLLPAEHRLLDQHLVHRRVGQPLADHAGELVAVVGDAAALAAQRVGGPQHDREAVLVGELLRLLLGIDVHRHRRLQADLGHRLLEAQPVLGGLDRVEVGAQRLHPVLLQHAGLVQLHREVQRGLAAQGGQQRVRLLLLDHRPHRVGGQRLDVGGVGDRRVGHDRGGVGVDQDDPQALLAQHLAGLRARVVELGGLPDHDRAGPEHEHRGDVVATRHQRPPFVVAPAWAAIMSTNLTK
jgi:hypothetical protein